MTFHGLNPPYRTIVADPPWGGATHARSKGRRGSAEARYSVLSPAQVGELDVDGISDESAHLWLWTINGHIEAAHCIARQWGFRPITMLTWCKPGPGVGYYLRNNTEHAVFATRGRPMVPEVPAIASWFEWPRGVHSEKPSSFMDLVEQLSPPPRLELFARQPRLGWDSWGFGVEGVIAATEGLT